MQWTGICVISYIYFFFILIKINCVTSSTTLPNSINFIVKYGVLYATQGT